MKRKVSVLKNAVHEEEEDEFPVPSAPEVLLGMLRVFRNLLLHPFSMPWRYVPFSLRHHLLELWYALTYPEE